MNRYGMDLHDEDIDEVYARELEYRAEQAGPKREPWTFWRIAVLLADVLLWWVLIAAVWKLWPR